MADSVGTPWRDTPSYGRAGWRERAAYLGGDEIFAVDYGVCDHCAIGWVEEAATADGYTRPGLATAGLAAIRASHPGITWHTAGCHLKGLESF
ncbi:hypothetical protein [Kribbella sp. NPDC000426]|uniref:hypothetical protein n=1 Tax=Kribbella sp. NPDC000426 TaxID=3154255 RepID=UPI00331E7095